MELRGLVILRAIILAGLVTVMVAAFASGQDGVVALAILVAGGLQALDAAYTLATGRPSPTIRTLGRRPRLLGLGALTATVGVTACLVPLFAPVAGGARIQVAGLATALIGLALGWWANDRVPSGRPTTA